MYNTRNSYLQYRYKIFKNINTVLHSIKTLNKYYSILPTYQFMYMYNEELTLVKYIEDDLFNGELKMIKQFTLTNKLRNSIFKYFSYSILLNAIFNNKFETLLEKILTINLNNIVIDNKGNELIIKGIWKEYNKDNRLIIVKLHLNDILLEIDCTNIKELLKLTKYYIKP